MVAFYGEKSAETVKNTAENITDIKIAYYLAFLSIGKTYLIKVPKEKKKS